MVNIFSLFFKVCVCFRSHRFGQPGGALCHSQLSGLQKSRQSEKEVKNKLRIRDKTQTEFIFKEKLFTKDLENKKTG